MEVNNRVLIAVVLFEQSGKGFLSDIRAVQILENGFELLEADGSVLVVVVVLEG